MHLTILFYEFCNIRHAKQFWQTGLAAFLMVRKRAWGEKSLHRCLYNFSIYSISFFEWICVNNSLNLC